MIAHITLASAGKRCVVSRQSGSARVSVEGLARAVWEGAQEPMSKRETSAGHVVREQKNSQLFGRRQALVLIGGAGLVRCGTDLTEQGASAREELGYIDGGVPPDSAPTLQEALDRYPTSSTPVTIVIDKLVEVSSSSATLIEVEPHVTLRFQDRGRLKPNANTTILLKGPIEAPPNPPVPIFDVSNGGKVVPSGSGTTYYVSWWSTDQGNADDIGQQWNNMVKGVEIPVIPGSPMPNRWNGYKGPTKFCLVGTHTLKTMMDIRQFQSGPTLDFTGSVINVEMNGGVAVNFTGAAGVSVLGLTLHCAGLSGKTADVGVLFSRSRVVKISGSAANNVESSHTFRLHDLRVLGSWNIAALYSVASESNVFAGGRWENLKPEGLFTAYFCHHVFNSLETDLPAYDYHPFPSVTVPTAPAGAPADWDAYWLPYDGSMFQLPPAPVCAGCDNDAGQTAQNPPDATVHGNELFGVTLVNKAVRGALYLRTAGVFSLHDARIESSAAPYVVLHAAHHSSAPGDPPCCISANDVGPLVVRNLIGVGYAGTTPNVAIRTLGIVCAFQAPIVRGGGQGSITVDLTARMLETAGANARELEIGRNFVRGRLSLPGLSGIFAEEGAWIAADIELRSTYEVPVKLDLGEQFFGRLKMGAFWTAPPAPNAPQPLLGLPITRDACDCPTPLPDPPHQSCDDPIPATRGIIRSFHATGARVRHYSPLSIAQQNAPAVFDKEAVLWVQGGQLKLKIKRTGQSARCKTFT
jgi:hypothetical protein